MNKLIFQWGRKHSNILSCILMMLVDNNVRHFVLRNYEGLPDINESKDVDVIIEPGTFEKVRKLFIDALKSNGVSNYYQMDFERAHCCFGIDVEKSFAIHVDFIEGYANKGYEFVSFEELYANTIEYNGFRVLNDAYDSCILFMYKVIGCNQLKDKYREKIYKDFTNVDSKCQFIIKRLLGDSFGSMIVDQIQKKQFESILNQSKKINRIAKRKVICRHPVSTICGIIRFFWEKFVNMVICPKSKQHLIAVEAPDGTGKTTFIDTLRVKIAEFFVTDLEKSTIYHFRPTILANLGAVGEKAGVMKQDTDFTNPHRAKPANSLSSLVRFVYYWLDYVIGVPLIVRKGAQFDHFPIFDRYIYDFIVDPARTRINLPKWLRVMFSHLVKQPQIVFVLNTDAEVIYKRKQELEEDEIRRQLIEFRSLKEEFKNVYLLDAGQTPDEIANDAIRIIVDKFTEKI